MAKLPILTYPAKSLKQESKPVKDFNSRLVDLVKDMFETMYDAQGIGLAAPQIGENIDLLVMDVPQQDLLDPEKYNPNPLCFINPKIIGRNGKIFYEEGCLSCPDLLVEVERDKDIIVEAVDVEGNPITHKLTDLTSVCLQHEMDHLAGKLLTDYISRLKRDRYKKTRIRERKDENDTGDV